MMEAGRVHQTLPGVADESGYPLVPFLAPNPIEECRHDFQGLPFLCSLTCKIPASCLTTKETGNSQSYDIIYCLVRIIFDQNNSHAPVFKTIAFWWIMSTFSEHM